MRSFFARASVLACAVSACSASPPSASRSPSPAHGIVTTVRAEPSHASRSARITRYSVVVMGRSRGQAVSSVHPDGTRETSYAYVNNGRGPKVNVRLSVDSSGLLSSFEAHGSETMGAPIDETFSAAGTSARWSSKAERGETAKAEGAFYVPLAPFPETLGLLAAAAKKAGGRIALLPAGEARLEKTTETTVRGETGEKHVTGYALTGLSFTPTRLWMNDDDTLFGITDAGMSFIETGYEDESDRLVRLNQVLDDAREADLAERLAKRPASAGLAFTHARVFDADSKSWRLDHTVVIAGGKIVAVGPSARTTLPPGTEIVDVAGKAIVPGLWDMHVHLARGDGELDIASGVTTVRDLGNDPDRVDRLKARFDAGTAVGPRVLRAGLVEGRGEKALGSKITAETEDEAKDAVRFFADRGYEQIKIYNSVKPELVPILTREAHARGMRVSGHVPVHMRAEEVVRAGYDEIQHVNMLLLNFFVDEDTDTRTTLRFSLVADKAPELDLASERVKGFIELLADKKTVIDPTLTVFEHLFTARLGEMSPSYAAIADRLPAQVRRSYLSGALPVPEGKEALYDRSFEKALAMVKALHAANVPLVCGTDALVGFSLHRELELRVRAGIPAGDVLYSATLGSARVMKKAETTGSIEIGKDADMIVVDGDPLARIEDIRKVRTTVRGGVVYAAGDVYEAMGVRR